jgi:hypothetical protein
MPTATTANALQLFALDTSDFLKLACAWEENDPTELPIGWDSLKDLEDAVRCYGLTRNNANNSEAWLAGKGQLAVLVPAGARYWLPKPKPTIAKAPKAAKPAFKPTLGAAELLDKLLGPHVPSEWPESDAMLPHPQAPLTAK